MNESDKKTEKPVDVVSPPPVESAEQPIINTVEPPANTYIFNRRAEPKKTNVPQVVFLVEFSKTGSFSFSFTAEKPFANTVFNSAIDTFPDKTSFPSQTNFNISTTLKMAPYKEEFMKNPALLTDSDKFDKWEKAKTQLSESVVLTNKTSSQKVEDGYLCENIVFLTNLFFGTENILKLNNLQYKIIRKSWKNKNYAKGVCDPSAVSLMYKSEYLKFYKDPFSLSSSQQKLSQTRENIQKMKEAMKKPESNYYANLKKQLELNEAMALEALLSVKIIYNEWITIKRPIYVGGDRKEPDNIDSYPSLDDLKTDADKDDSKLDMFLTLFLKNMTQLYLNLYYFTQMNLETFKIVNKSKTDIYNPYELKTLVKNLEKIKYKSVEGKFVNLYESSSSYRTSKVESINKKIEKEENLPLILGTFLLFDLLVNSDYFDSIIYNSSRYISVRSDRLEDIRKIFTVEDNKDYIKLIQSLMDKYVEGSDTVIYDKEVLYNRVLNSFGIFYYLSYYNHCLTNAKKQVEDLKRFDVDLLNIIYSSWSAKKKNPAASNKMENEKIFNSVDRLTANLNKLNKVLIPFSNTSMSMYISAPLNLERIISKPIWMPKSENVIDSDKNLEGYAYLLYLNATKTDLDNFRTPSMQSVEQRTETSIQLLSEKAEAIAKLEAEEKTKKTKEEAEAKAKLEAEEKTKKTKGEAKSEKKSTRGGAASGDVFSTFSSASMYSTEKDEIQKIINKEQSVATEENIIPIIIFPSIQVDNLCFNKNIRMTQIMKSQVTLQTAFIYLNRILKMTSEQSIIYAAPREDYDYMNQLIPDKKYVINLYTKYTLEKPIIYLVNNLTENETYRLQIFPENNIPSTETDGYQLILQEGEGCYIYYDVTYNPNPNITKFDNLTRSECVNLFLFKKSGGRSTEVNKTDTNTYYVEVDVGVSAVNKSEEFQRKCNEKWAKLSTQYKSLRTSIGSSTFVKPDLSSITSELDKYLQKEPVTPSSSDAKGTLVSEKEEEEEEEEEKEEEEKEEEEEPPGPDTTFDYPHGGEIHNYVGLENCGVHCYRNSVLQVLAHTPEFIKLFGSLDKKESNAAQIRVSESLNTLLNQLNKTQPTDQTYTVVKDPKKFTDTINPIIKSTYKKISINRQEDAADFLQVIFDIVSKSLKNKPMKNIHDKNEDLFNLCETVWKNEHPNYNDLYNNFYGTTVNTKTNPLLFTPFDILNLYSTRPKIEKTIYDCFNTMIENRDYLYSLPDIFIIRINRIKKAKTPEETRSVLNPLETMYREDDYKYPINIPEALDDLKEYTFKSPEDRENIKKYNLYAAITHTGTGEGGHYTSTIKIGQKWYNFNDNIVTIVTDGIESDYIRKGYLYFYKLSNTRTIF